MEAIYEAHFKGFEAAQKEFEKNTQRKIKPMENGKFILKGLSVHLNIEEIEVSLDDLGELENRIATEVTEKFCEVVKGKMKESNSELYYHGDMGAEIKKGDKVRILPSENCVTNGDDLVYDEKIDGLTGIVNNIFPSSKKVSIKLDDRGYSIVVHNNWLEMISRSK